MLVYSLFLHEGHRKLRSLNKARVCLHNATVSVICNEKTKGENDITTIVEYHSTCSKNIAAVLGSPTVQKPHI